MTTEKMTAFNRPHNVKTIKSFLGLCNYYRPFVPNFADLAKPMNRLLKKEIPFEWTEACEEAFQKLKVLLTSPPLLIHPEIGGHFHLLTDASDAACGAAVCQKIRRNLPPGGFLGMYTKGRRAKLLSNRKGSSSGDQKHKKLCRHATRG